MKKKGGSSRFPVARIKKIMQADEDVGKVAQATPLLVSKAVELFMESLVEEASKDAQQRASKKVQPYHLKQAVMRTAAFDFLKDIVAKVPDPLESGAEVADAKKKTNSTHESNSTKVRDWVPEEQEEEEENDEEEEEYY